MKEKPKIPGAVIFFIIFAIAFVFRLIYLHQLSHTYFFKPFKGGYDDFVFDTWAREMLKGNWAGDLSMILYRMPLYAYFLWFVYYLLGHNYWAVYIIQAAMGALSCGLVYLIGSRLAGKAAGAAAGLLYAFYGVSLYYMGMLVGETLSVLICCAAVLFFLSFQEKGGLWRLFLGGLLFGGGMLTRGNMLVVFPFLLLWLIWIYGRRSLGKTGLYCAILSLGVMLAVIPITIRNYIYTKDIVPISSQGGINIYIGNSYGADGKFRAIKGIGSNLEHMIPASVKIAEEKTGKALKPSQVSDFWVKETLRSVNEHGGIWFIAPLMIKKAFLFWSAYELPDIWDYYFVKQYLPALGFAFATFALIASLAFAGMYLSWKRRREFSVIYAFVIGYMISLVLVFINSRYRSPVVPFLAVFAGYAAAVFFRPPRTGAWKTGIAAVIAVAVFLASNAAIAKLSFETSHNSLAILLKRDGKFDEAIEEYNKAIECAPGYPSPYYNLGILYMDRGDPRKAAYYFRKTLQVDPNFESAREKLKRLGEGSYQ